MKTPIILYEKFDLSVHPSVKHAESSIEVWDAKDNLYVAYDAEGFLLNISIKTITKDHHFLFFKWLESYEVVCISEKKPRTNQANELREILTSYLFPRELDSDKYQSLSLSELIQAASNKMPWRIK